VQIPGQLVDGLDDALRSLDVVGAALAERRDRVRALEGQRFRVAVVIPDADADGDQADQVLQVAGRPAAGVSLGAS
jgi:hypothetical protein